MNLRNTGPLKSAVCAWATAQVLMPGSFCWPFKSLVLSLHLYVIHLIRAFRSDEPLSALTIMQTGYTAWLWKMGQTISTIDNMRVLLIVKIFVHIIYCNKIFIGFM